MWLLSGPCGTIERVPRISNLISSYLITGHVSDRIAIITQAQSRGLRDQSCVHLVLQYLRIFEEHTGSESTDSYIYPNTASKVRP